MVKSKDIKETVKTLSDKDLASMLKIIHEEKHRRDKEVSQTYENLIESIVTKDLIDRYLDFRSMYITVDVPISHTINYSMDFKNKPRIYSFECNDNDWELVADKLPEVVAFKKKMIERFKLLTKEVISIAKKNKMKEYDIWFKLEEYED